MARSPSRSKSKPVPRKVSTERRRATRGNLKLLTAFRCLDAGKESYTGFVRALNLSPIGALLESPDKFAPGQNLALEFLLDNNRIAQTSGRVSSHSRPCRGRADALGAKVAGRTALRLRILA